MTILIFAPVLIIIALLIWLLLDIRKVRRIRREYAALTQIYIAALDALQRGDMARFDQLDAEHEHMGKKLSEKYGYKI